MRLEELGIVVFEFVNVGRGTELDSSTVSMDACFSESWVTVVIFCFSTEVESKGNVIDVVIWSLEEVSVRNHWMSGIDVLFKRLSQLI